MALSTCPGKKKKPAFCRKPRPCQAPFDSLLTISRHSYYLIHIYRHRENRDYVYYYYQDHYESNDTTFPFYHDSTILCVPWRCDVYEFSWIYYMLGIVGGG